MTLSALAVAPGVGLGMATTTGKMSVARGIEDPSVVVRLVEDALHPRWVLWSNDTAATLLRAGLRIATCWDVAAVHRLLFGGWRADPACVWAQLQHLALGTIPTTAPADLFGDAGRGDGDPDDPIRPDGHLRPEWLGGGWCATPERLRRWAELAARVAVLQQARLGELGEGPRVASTARSQSAAELLCVEMSVDGLPMDRAVAEGIIEGFVGRRPRTEAEAASQRARRDAEVLRHAPAGLEVDLRSPGQVKSLLSRIGVEVPDTRAWRLRTLRDTHPLIEALLVWRKAERVATTFGYGWLDEHLGADGRLRGVWTGSDGAAGRMTASGGLHNMPAEMRGAVVAEPGHVFVRADLGQIEPRVLAAISRDEQLARATARGRHVRACGRPARRGSSYRQGRDARSDVRADHRPRPAGAAPPRGRLPRGDEVPRRRCTLRPGRPRPANLWGQVDHPGTGKWRRGGGRARPVGRPQPGAATAVMPSSKVRPPSCSSSGQ